MATKRIGILTGGGDVPGLNAVIKNVVYRASEHDIEVVGIRRGWEGLTHVNLEDPASKARYIMPLSPRKYPHRRSYRRHIPALQPHESIQDEEDSRISRRAPSFPKSEFTKEGRHVDRLST